MKLNLSVLAALCFYCVFSVNLTEEEVNFYIRQQLRSDYDAIYQLRLNMEPLEANIVVLTDQLQNMVSPRDGAFLENNESLDIVSVISNSDFATVNETLTQTPHQQHLQNIVQQKLLWQDLNDSLTLMNYQLEVKTDQMFNSYFRSTQ